MTSFANIPQNITNVEHGFLVAAHTCHKQRITPTIEITSHTKSHTQCHYIKSKNVKNR